MESVVEPQVELAQAAEEKEDIFLDRLWAQDTPELWQEAIDKGLRGIETNRPAELSEFPRAKKLHP